MMKNIIFVLFLPFLICATTRPSVTGREITPKQQDSVNRGLEWLASQQAEDGGFSNNGNEEAAITALSGLAFMQNGSLPLRGKFGKNVQGCLEKIISLSQPDGLIGNQSNPMYGHGFATIFLGEIYGMTGEEEIREKLTKAVLLIEKAQNPQGGWRYTQLPYDADLSATICQIIALRSARDAGVKVEKSVIDKAIDYVKKCQITTGSDVGGFSYQLDIPSGANFTRTAAGITALYYMGHFEGKEVEQGLAYLSKNKNTDPMWFYGEYYGVQAMFLAGGKYWEDFYPKACEELFEKQSPEGNWKPSPNEYQGEQYATAMALFILQLPNQYLPLNTGKGSKS